jgi:hypothetical protein
MVVRRLIILLAVLMGLTALAAGVAPRRPVSSGQQAAPAAPAQSPQAPIERTLTAGASEPETIVADVGRIVVLHVKADALDSVSLGELGKIEPVTPESPARFELLAEFPGSYPIELLAAGRRLGTLEIRATR